MIALVAVLLATVAVAGVVIAVVVRRERRAALALQESQDAAGEARHQAEEARGRAARFQAVTDALAETMTRSDVADAIIREGLVAMRAQGCAVFGTAAHVQGFEPVATAGYPDELTVRWVPFEATADGPAAEAIRTRALVVAETSDEIDSRWPHLAEARRTAGDEALLSAPLLVGNEAAGALLMAFREPRTFDATERGFMQSLARQCAQALERARLYEVEQDARAQAERLAARLRRLQTVIDATFVTSSVDELLRDLLVRLRDAIESDTATILTVDESGEALVVRDSVGFGGPIQTRVPIGEGFAGRIAATRSHHVVGDLSKIHVVSPYLRTSGLKSLAGVPLVADGRLVGVAHVGSKRMRDFDREDILLLRLVAARAAVAIDRAEVHEREHDAAEILQRSLLPERLPALDGVEIAARYVPGTVGMAVGGDWYDVFELVDGSIGIAVGDVVGRGVQAAATMGRLRHVLRAYAAEGFGPADALARLNRLACLGNEEVFATVVYALVAPTRERLRIASAGHPPVLERRADGSVHEIEGGRGLPIGAVADAAYTEVELPLEPESTLVLYTDGLVERRSESIDTGIGRLTRLLRDGNLSLDELADQVVERLESTDHTDDVAFLAIQLEPSPTRLALQFPAEPKALAPVRSSLRTWLAGNGAGEDEIFDILVAVNEACSNAVEHPLERTEPDVSLDAEVDETGELTIAIRDRGSWRPAGPRGDRGRGLDFMGALMENVEVDASVEGTTVRLTRRLRRGGAAVE